MSGGKKEAFRISKLGTPTAFVLDYCAPQVNFAVDSELFVAALA